MRRASNGHHVAPPRPTRSLGGPLLLPFALLLAVAGCAGPAPGPPDPSAVEAEPLVRQRILEATEAVTADPSSVEAWGRLGQIYDIHRFAEQALVCYDRAIELSPEDWRWPYFAGVVLRETDLSAAAARFERAVELEPDYAPIHLYLGAAHLLLEDLDGSFEHFSRALELAPDSINARIGLARVAQARGELDRALTLLEEAVGLAPEEAATHKNLAQVYRRLGREEDAQREQWLADWSPVEMQPGDMASFRDPVRDEITFREGVSSTWLLENSRRMMADGNQDQAFEFLETALAADPDSEIALLGTSRILFNRGDLAQARQRAEHALAVNPQSAAAHVELGNLLARSGDVEGAIREFEAAIELDPSSAEAQNNLPSLLFEIGRTEEGLDRLREAAEALPGETNIQFNLAVALQRSGKPSEALEVLDALTALRPGFGPGLYMLGYLRASQGSYDEAARLFARAVEREPGNLAARIDLGRAFWELGRFADAVGAWAEARRVAPNNPEIARELAWALATCPDDAVRDGTQALALARTLAEQSGYRDARLLDVLAAAQAETGDFEGAATTERRAVMIVERLLEEDRAKQPAEKAAMQRFLESARQRAEIYRGGRAYRDRP